MPKRTVVPSIFLHKTSGQAAFKHRGKFHYLGKWGSPDIQKVFAAKLQELQFSPGAFSLSDPTMTAVMELFRKEYERRHANSPWLSIKLSKIDSLVIVVKEVCPGLPASFFGPKWFRMVRERFAECGKRKRSAGHINECMRLVREAVKWACGQEMLDYQTWERLRLVEPLSSDRIERQPVANEIVEATIPHCPYRTVVLIRLMQLTAARPREIMTMRAEHIDRNGPEGTWVYRPAVHKNQHRGKKRSIVFGGKAQRVLAEWLGEKTTGLVFPSHLVPAIPYSHSGFCKSIRQACDRAKVQRWHPYQLRHARITELSEKQGREVAQAVAGHASIRMTQHYDHSQEQVAARVMKEAG